MYIKNWIILKMGSMEKIQHKDISQVGADSQRRKDFLLINYQLDNSEDKDNWVL